MAKKQPVTNAVKAPSPVATPVRNTAIPKAVAAKPARVITHDMIAVRAHEISHSAANRGSDHENWYQAERELKGI